MNRRASAYIHDKSEAAKGNANGLDSPGVLYEDVVVLGYTELTEELRHVP